MVLKNFGTDVINLAKNYNTLNIMSDKQVVSVERLTKRLNSLKDTGNLTTKSITGLYKSVDSLNSDSLTYYFQSVAEGAENARVNIVDAYAAILDGNTHGLKNVQSIMNTFNNSFGGSVEKQKEFTKAIGQSNKGLANYLNSIEAGGTATLKGYAGQLVKTTAKTVLLTAKTIALQAALSAGLTWIISLVVQGFNNLITAEQNLIDTANETAEKVEEEVNALEQLRQKYIEVCDSADDEVAKNEKLNEIKQELVDTYGFEREAIEQLNLERQKGLDLLDSEIEKENRIARNDWLKTNEQAVKNANFNLGNTLTGKSVYSNTTNNGGISDTILNLFDNKNISDGFVRLSFDMDDIVDGLNKTKDIYNEILEIQSRRSLTEDELSLLNKVKSDLDYLQDLYDKYYETYSTAAKYNVQNLVENYLETDEGKLESVGKDTFKSWSNGLIKQAENAEQKRQIQKYIEETFPDLTKYFNNLETAKKMFVGGANPNSGYTAQIKNYLEALSDEDLEIATKIPDLFADGLEKATAKIEAWKKDPNNVIKPTVDTKPLEEMAGEVSSKVKLIVSAMEDMKDTGHISSSTYAEIIEMGGNYVECLELQDGQLKLNIEKLKELETQEYKNAISANNLAIAHKSLGINSQYDYEEWSKFKKQLEEENALYQILIDEIYGASPKETDSKSTGDPNKEAFDTANNLRKHWLAMGKDNTGKKYTEEMYYAWLDSADGYKKYFSDLTKYTDEYRQYEEEIYKWRINKDKELFEERIENYEKLKDKELNDSEYDNPIKKYEEAGKIINQEMSAIQSRIQELVESGSSAVQDEIDSLKEKHDSLKEEQKELQKDIWDTRVENEKTFWELQKEAVETYYDNEIKKLEEIEDEQERINKKEELRLNLIKAQQELLDAKKNRNQLLFANGGFYYDYDQEAVQKAQENITNAEQDITDFNNDETKHLLEEQRDNEITYYNTIIKMLEAYINKTLPIETSDSEVFNTAMSSKYAQSVLNKQTEITSVTLKSFLQDRFPNYNKQALDSGYDLLGKIMNKPVSSTLNAWDNLKKMNAQNYTVNNNNNNSVYIENMPITVPVGTTEEQVQAMIDQFASGVISTVRAKRAKLQ